MATATATLYEQMQGAISEGPDDFVHWLYELKLLHPQVKVSTEKRASWGDKPEVSRREYFGTVIDVGVDFSPYSETFFITIAVPRATDPIKVFLSFITHMDVAP